MKDKIVEINKFLCHEKNFAKIVIVIVNSRLFGHSHSHSIVIVDYAIFQNSG